MDPERFPGGVLVSQGLRDLARGENSIPALLGLVGAPRLRRLGLPIPETRIHDVEHVLYERLAEADADAAHGRYNALIRLLVSFERAAECAG